MVMVLPANEAVTPAGNPVGAPIPVAPVVVKVTAVPNAELRQSVGEAEAAVTVLLGVTVMVPVALTAPQPPVSGME